MLRAVDLILKKRNGQELTKEEVDFFIKGYISDDIPDYQMSALLMAIYFQKLNFNEMTNLTVAMLQSGEQIDLSGITGIKVDKHSTGGVGDKTSLVVGPLVAALGLKMAKMSGRGLGHTGGTLDKLESIPGFQIEMSGEKFIRQVNAIGLALIGQSKSIALADKKLYALRDVTGTVESIGLIASSIMSKKLASGADHIVLDVKVGSGAFMKDQVSAKSLARAMVEIGKEAGKKTVAVLTSMDQPLGLAVGNALEVIEAVETLKGKGPTDFKELCLTLGEEIALVSGLVKTEEEAKEVVKEALESGRALEKFRQMIEAQGGNSAVIEDYSLFPQVKEIVKLTFEGKEAAYIRAIDALKIGEAAMILGAGRVTKADIIDYGVGIVLKKKVSDFVLPGEVVASVYSNGLATEAACQLAQMAFQYGKQPVQKNQLVLEIVK